MEMLRELAPFIVGAVLPPLVMLAVRTSNSGQLKFALTLLPALALGFCTSLFAGELAQPAPDALMAVIIDTSLVFTGSQLAHRLLCKRLLEERLVLRDRPAPQRVRR
jgi:hypothetical protein